MTTCIRLRSPSELVAVLPYQLGYHPQSSVVVVAFHGARLGVVQRLDLPTPAEAHAAAEALLALLVRERPDSVVLIGYETHAEDSRAVLDALAAACRPEGIEVHERLVVRDGLWFSLDCQGSCCPSQGTSVPGPAEVPMLAEFVGREIAPLPGRRELAAGVQVGDHSRARRICALGGEIRAARADEDTSESGLRAWEQVLRADDSAPPVTELDEEVCARAAVALDDVDLRDAVVSWLCPGSLPAELVDERLRAQVERALPARGWGSSADERVAVAAQGIALQRVERRLTDLCAALEDDCAVATLTVLGAFAWWRGDGALSAVALQRALKVDPSYRLAMLVEQMVQLGIRPEGRR